MTATAHTASVITTATAHTPAAITLNIFELWLDHWQRSWEDVGRLHHARTMGEHIGVHDDGDWTAIRGGWCQCWKCRVQVAWKKRHEAVPRYRKKVRK